LSKATKPTNKDVSENIEKEQQQKKCSSGVGKDEQQKSENVRLQNKPITSVSFSRVIFFITLYYIDCQSN